MIPVTKPHLPNIDVYKSYIDRIYQSNQLTNNGPLVKELELKLKQRWGVKNVILVANGTLALQVIYKALGLSKKVATTPFSFIATASSLSWESIEPKFIDIKPDDLTLDPKRLENIPAKDIEAIIPVHVYGNPCDVQTIQEIAESKGWKVIYDAAHAFDCEYKGKSILEYGDASTISFHATKLFHTVEGGAIVTNDEALATKVRSLINFGYTDGIIDLIGTNAKMSEVHAAMGLAMLTEIDSVIDRRKRLIETYIHHLPSELTTPLIENYNGSYFPVLFPDEKLLIKAVKKLESKNIYARRYFYPSLDQLPIFRSLEYCQISSKIASRVLCLPLYSELSDNDVKYILELLV